jgi:antitoxin FitA
MTSVTIRNVPDEGHRAIRVRAAQHGRSIEAEMRDILEAAVKPQGRVKLGSLLAEIGVALMPAGKCRTQLHEHLEKQVLPLCAGRSIATADACIAAVAMVNGLVVAGGGADRHQSLGRSVNVVITDPW